LEDLVSCISSVVQGETSTPNYDSALHIAIEVTREQIIADVKGKAIPLQAWTGPQGSRKLRFPNFKTIGT
jgi:hypothetical protein